MEDNNKTPVTLQAIKILEYWHKIEFFESTNIEALEDNTEGVLQIDMDALQTFSSLPWINPQQIRRAGESYSLYTKYNYELFFGIFDRKEIFSRAKRIFPDAANNLSDETLGDEGRTCSIKCLVDQDGVIDSDSFAFSTVTWALGQLEIGALDRLRFDVYQEATENLHMRFKEIITVTNNIKKEHRQPLVLTTYEIIEFLKAMVEWTKFSPEKSVPALFIKLKKTKTKKKSDQTSQQLNPDKLANLRRLASLTLPSNLDQSSLSERHSVPEITILNSFYLRDIENALNQIKNSGLEPNSPLGRYLTGSRNKKPDLLMVNGRALLLEKLRLSHLPAGRWPSDAKNNMSLMQQFAINTLEQELALSGLYSINGSPGTGKTTMLRDLIANNLVKRAKVLAGLEQASEAFDRYITEEIAGELRAIPCLSPALSGYEMVVASSNNAAVENISRELPLIKSLGSAWQQISYLKPVAQKLAAPTHDIKFSDQNDGKSFKISPLTQETECWGLIAAALGKQENRGIFGERVFYKKHENARAASPADSYRTLFAAIHQLPNKRFSEAKSAFNQALEHYEHILHELKKLEALCDQQNACRQRQLKLEKLQTRQLKLNAFLAKRYVRTPAWRTLQIKKICREKALTKGLNRRLTSVQASIKLEEHRFQKALAMFNAERLRCTPLKQKYDDVLFASPETNLEAAEVQRTTFGHGQALNESRSLLTVRALELHQAWLVTAYKECKLKDAVRSIMYAINGSLKNKQTSLALWRLLFMIVPVISSTFASVARQFSAFSAGDIGWLFIDEAGQATPQQAAAALWRAKRAVVVGDPLQIEPVFTIPPAFVEVIAKREFGEAWKEWAPTVQSVQNLADRVNPYGTMQISKNIWLGSPLRVHRRCDEPMFSIANAIAYNNKMFHGRDLLWPQDECLLGNSCWFDICGEVEGKHYVPAQGQHVLTMLKTWLEHNSTLPDLYIISPFKQVKQQLQAFLRKALHNVKNNQEWINKRVGTVHTFQGKEEKSVIFVLGLSTKCQGAAKWASEKPNLLNVAITRAQHHVYIVGSKNIWSSCQYFNIAHAKLGEVARYQTPTKSSIQSLDSSQRFNCTSNQLPKIDLCGSD